MPFQAVEAERATGDAQQAAQPGRSQHQVPRGLRPSVHARCSVLRGRGALAAAAGVGTLAAAGGGWALQEKVRPTSHRRGAR